MLPTIRITGHATRCPKTRPPLRRPTTSPAISCCWWRWRSPRATSATAIWVARLFVGDAPDFSVSPLPTPGFVQMPLFFALGAIVAVLAVAHNHALLAAIAAFERIKQLPVEGRTAAIGAGVGVLAWFAPDLVGGGDNITQSVLAGQQAMGFLLFAFLVRFLLGAASYAAGTPGGLFAPLLVLGAQSGALFGALCQFALPGLGIQSTAFAVVGMAAFFTGVVRAPVTGIVLVLEMTGSVTLLLPMMCACCLAMVVPALLRNVPIYEALREHTLRKEQALTRGPARAGRMVE